MSPDTWKHKKGLLLEIFDFMRKKTENYVQGMHFEFPVK